MAEEKLAEDYLKKQGLKTLTRNFHSRFGEIDLIMQDKQVIVFIEVRARKQHAQVSAIDSIHPSKINKIRVTAEQYLLQFDELPECRFDFVAITTDNSNENNKIAEINWLQNVF